MEWTWCGGTPLDPMLSNASFRDKELYGERAREKDEARRRKEKKRKEKKERREQKLDTTGATSSVNGPNGFS